MELWRFGELDFVLLFCPNSCTVLVKPLNWIWWYLNTSTFERVPAAKNGSWTDWYVLGMAYPWKADVASNTSSLHTLSIKQKKPHTFGKGRIARAETARNHCAMGFFPGHFKDSTSMIIPLVNTPVARVRPVLWLAWSGLAPLQSPDIRSVTRSESDQCLGTPKIRWCKDALLPSNLKFAEFIVWISMVYITRPTPWKFNFATPKTPKMAIEVSNTSNCWPFPVKCSAGLVVATLKLDSNPKQIEQFSILLL